MSNEAADMVDVTVTVMSYNNAAYIAATLQSILDQEGVTLEVIVRDDGSSDGSRDVLRSFPADPRLTIHYHEENVGMVANANRCFGDGRGRYIVVFGSDDIMLPNHLSSLVRALDEAPQASLGYCQCEWIDKSGDFIRYADHPGHYRNSYVGGRNEVADLLSLDNYVTPSAMIIRRNVLDAVREADGNVHAHMLAGDWDLVIRIAEVSPDFVFLRQAGVRYRMHGSQLSQSFYASDAPLRDHISILERFIERGRVDLLRSRENDVTGLLLRRLDSYRSVVDIGTLQARAHTVIANLRSLLATQALDSAPFFSVILTTYNRPRLLRDALLSLAAQTFRDFEVILVNDCGPMVESVLEGLSFPVTYIRQGANAGLSAARNAGIRLARGRHLCYLDDDDLYKPDHLAELFCGLTQNPGCLVYTASEHVFEDIQEDVRVVQKRVELFSHEAFDADLLQVRNYIPVNTWSHPRSLLAETGDFDISLTALEDWDMLLRLAVKCQFVHVRKCTVEVRQRQANAATDHMTAREGHRLPNLYREIYRRYPVDPATDLESKRRQLLHSLRSVPDADRSAIALESWLAQREPNSVQRAMIQAHLTVAPVVKVVVLDSCGEIAKVHSTLGSLCLTAQMFPHVRIAVISSALTSPSTVSSSPYPTVWRRASVDRWSDEVNAQAIDSDADWVVFVNAGETFTKSGLIVLAQELKDAPAAFHAVYADEIERSPDGLLTANMRPDFNLDFFLSNPGRLARHWVFRCTSLREMGGFASPSAWELDYLLRLIETQGMEGLGHVPEALVIADSAVGDPITQKALLMSHLQRRGYAGAQIVSDEGLGCHRLLYGHEHTPVVSIIIPTRDHFSLLTGCVDSILSNTAYQNYEVLIVDNDSEDKAVRQWLNGVEALQTPQLRVLRYPFPFNFAAMNNLAAKKARGEYLLFLNNDIEITKADWLDALLNHALRPEVGVVGAKLLYPDGTIQHAGLILGLRGPASSIAIGEADDVPCPMQILQCDRNVSAVTGACLMIRASVFEQAGRMDEDAFPVTGADVDLCLNVRKLGYLIVWTPHAELRHEGGYTLVSDKSGAAARDAMSLRADDVLYSRWMRVIAHDSAHNPQLSLQGKGYQVDTHNLINWRPLRWRPLPVTLALPADQQGCGHYRVIMPSRAMTSFGLAESSVGERYLSVVEMERLTPDVVVLQRQVLRHQIDIQTRVAQFSQSFKVAELDDYMLNLPVKSVHRIDLPKDIVKAMRESLRLVDRFVVSTPALAEALSGFHPDMRVVQNRLPLPWWTGLAAQRRQGRRPRVGWAGGSSHQGDLEMITDVVKALADEVEWVFFGMCPDSLRPYLHEFHAGVEITAYPARLASLNLDLALAPLEDNLFNRCKSNLRLLEYGACGFPVVCSNLTPYQGDLPVTRVKSRFKDWVDAIRMHINDLDATAAAGDALRSRVLQDWMLDETASREWLTNWLPA